MWLIKVSGVPGYFETKTGGESSSEVSKIWDGGSLKPDLMSGPPDIANVVVSRVYKHDRDYPTITTLRKNVGRWRTTVTVTPTNVDLGAYSRQTVYPEALLVRVSEPDADASSNEPARFELEFAIKYIR